MITPDSAALGERKAILWIARAVSYIVYFYLIVVEIILAIGFFLLLFGANPTAGFTQWAYRNLDRVMDPFRGIFSPVELGATGNDVQAVFDTSILFAMIIYGIVALVLGAVIQWLSNRLQQIHDVEQYRRQVADLAAQQAEIERRQADVARAAAAQAFADQAAGVEGQSAPMPGGGQAPPPPPPRTGPQA